MARPDHAPEGFPICARCGVESERHRVEHYPSHANHCDCGLPIANHRIRAPRVRLQLPRQWWGLDGEGQGREDHRYTLLACVDETGQNRKWIEAKPNKRLTTKQCLEFLCNLPYTKVFSYSFNYDLTKMLTDLDNRSLWRLFHENVRQRKGKRKSLGPRGIEWNGFIINLQRTKFSVKRVGTRRTVIVWDIWKFFQGKFTAALESWAIGTKQELETMARMKDQRADFDKLTPEKVREYCFDECAKLAQLARKLTEAHESAGLPLKNYYGAGSTASAMLKSMGIRELRGATPDEMKEVVASAFFGGRFENAVIGSIPGPVWSYDISSAYPYELCFLPCMVHGVWSHTKRRKHLERARAAIVRYSLGTPPFNCTWGPFPFRLSGKEKGSIAFPIQSDGGWIYLEEFLEGESLFPHVRFHEAYILESDCDCKPFQKVPGYYRERVKLGKEAKGIVFKLGINSCYGKLAQSLGDNPPFQQWIWAGMITSGTRASILRMAARLSSLHQLLMVATDGIYTRERVELPPRPLDTGTYDCVNKDGQLVPLGGWEEKLVKQGVFAARPGIYFPLNPTDKELKEVRARGIGKSVLFQCWNQIQDAFEKGESAVKIENWKEFNPLTNEIEERRLSRFMGAKSSVYKLDDEYKRSKTYGQWIHRPINMDFNPLPKRERVCDDGVSLELRTVKGQSLPYSKAVGMRTPEALLLRIAEQEASEQPDGGDFANY